VAQKTIQKVFSSEEIHTLSIKDDGIFKISITSSENSEIIFKVHISGENSENVIIEKKLADGILSLKTGFTPFFILENDKLAAHKIMAVEVTLVVPKTVSIEIKSKLASVFANGKINSLAVSIENSDCELRNFSGNAHIKTIDGNIKVVAESNVSGIANSKNGTVENRLQKQGKFMVETESINGNIRLLQTK
jgi:hypothetical protein